MSDDPIYAVVQAHRAAAAAFGTTPGDHAAAAEFAALDRLARTEPRTIDGIIALLQYTQDFEYNELPNGFDRESPRSILRALTRNFPARDGPGQTERQTGA
jgi:hypothetical protein